MRSGNEIRTGIMAVCLLAITCFNCTAKEEAWVDLTTSINLWSLTGGTPIEGQWDLVDGVIHRAAKSSGIYTKKQYENFVLEFEFKVAKGGNSGVKYRMRKIGKKMLGLEYQVIDDFNYDKPLVPFHRTGSIYELIAAPDNKPFTDASTWNTGKIVANGTVLEHYLNGVKVAEIDQATDNWTTRFSGSKYKGADGFGTGPGFIYLQDHGAEAWFRNVRIQEL